MNITINEVKLDTTVSDITKSYELNITQMRICTREDFAQYNQAEYYDNYVNIGQISSFLCPDLGQFRLFGGKTSLKNYHISVIISECQENCE